MGVHDDVRSNYNAVGLAVMERMYSADYLSIGGTESTSELADRAQISASSRVLDVGCGLGGPALHLAERYGCRVTGLDLVEISIEQATERAADRGLSKLVDFRVGDAADMPFGDGDFTTVWGQDAWCHVPNKDALISECARVLEPGGVVAFTDWVVTGSTDIDLRERAMAAATSPDMATPSQYRDLLGLAGFVGIESTDISAQFVEQYTAICSALGDLKDELTNRFSARVWETVNAINHQVLDGFTSGEIGGVLFVAHKPVAQGPSATQA